MRGRSSVREFEAPERSRSGATTVTSPSWRSASASRVMPGAKYPSSFETKIRTGGFYVLFKNLRPPEPFHRRGLVGEAAHVGALLARQHLEVLVRGANVEAARDQRHLEGGPRRELLQVERSLVGLDLE